MYVCMYVCMYLHIRPKINHDYGMKIGNKTMIWSMDMCFIQPGMAAKIKAATADLSRVGI
jgi:hypothetical protein